MQTARCNVWGNGLRVGGEDNGWPIRILCRSSTNIINMSSSPLLVYA